MGYRQPLSRYVNNHILRRYSVYTNAKSGLWTPNNTVISPYKNITIPNISLCEYVWQNLEKWEHKTAVVCAVSNKSYTYSLLYRSSRNFAAKLRTQMKIRDVDVVCVMMPNSIDYPLAVLGALQAGAAVTAVNPASTIRELTHSLLCSNPKVIITTAEYFNPIKETMSSIRKKIPVIAVKSTEDPLPDGVISLHEFAEDDNVDLSILKEVKKFSEDVVLLPFSSGTTGMPKQVELVNRNIIASCITQDMDGIKTYNDTTSSHRDTILAYLPFFHIYGMVGIMIHKLTIGAKLVTMPRFQPETFVSSIKDHKVDILYAVPPTVLFMGSHPLVTKTAMKSIRSLVWGAAPMSPDDLDKCLDRFRPDLKVTQMYGSTESLLVSVSLSNNCNSGYAVSNNELKISDLENGENLGPNEIGELLIKSPQVMKSYRNDPEATKYAFDKDSWFKTGDLAQIDKDGSLKIVDRIKELIKVKGYQVPPTELENILKEHPCVLDAAVIGVPDKIMGEVPKAFVVLQNENDTQDDIKIFVNSRVSDYKRIRSISIVNDLPRSPSGKILRKVLKEEFC